MICNCPVEPDAEVPGMPAQEFGWTMDGRKVLRSIRFINQSILLAGALWISLTCVDAARGQAMGTASVDGTGDDASPAAVITPVTVPPVITIRSAPPATVPAIERMEVAPIPVPIVAPVVPVTPPAPVIAPVAPVVSPIVAPAPVANNAAETPVANPSHLPVEYSGLAMPAMPVLKNAAPGGPADNVAAKPPAEINAQIKPEPKTVSVPRQEPKIDSAANTPATAPATSPATLPAAVVAGIEGTPIHNGKTADAANAAATDTSTTNPAALGATNSASAGGTNHGLPSSITSAVQVATALVVVVGLILIGKSLVRKFVPGARAGGGKGVIEVLARHPLSKTQALVLVRIGSQIVALNQGKETSESVLVISEPAEVARIIGQIEGTHPKSMQAGFTKMLNNARIDLEKDGQETEAPEAEDLRGMSPENLDEQLEEMAAAKRQLMELRQHVRSVRDSMPRA